MRTMIGVATALLAVSPGLARAAEAPPPCLTAAEFSSLAAYALPSAITGTSKRCGPTLGANAYLKTSGSQLASRYATRKAAAWPGAKAAFMKLSQDKDPQVGNVFRKLSDEALREMVDLVLEGMVSQEIPLEKCGTIDDFVRLLAPLPAQNVAELIALTVGLASKSEEEAKVGEVAICPAKT